MIDRKKLEFIAYWYGRTICIIGRMVIGPIIPCIAEFTKLQQASYSYLYTCMFLGFVLGGKMCPYISNYINTSRHLMLSHLFGGIVFLGLFYSAQYIPLGIFTFLSGVCFSNVYILSNTCVLSLFKDQSQDFWNQLLDFTFTIGGILSSLIILFTKQMGIIYIGILNITGCLIYWYVTPIQKQEKKTQQISNNISNETEYILCIIFIIIVGIEEGFSNLIPVYLAITQIDSLELITLSYTCFYTCHLIGKLTLILISSKISIRLKYYIYCEIFVCAFAFLAAFFSYYLIAAYIGGGLIGYFISTLFPLMFALPSQFNLILTVNNVSKFIVWISFSQIFISSLLGYMMGYIHPIVLFCFVLIMVFPLYHLYHKLINLLRNDRKQIDNIIIDKQMISEIRASTECTIGHEQQKN